MSWKFLITCFILLVIGFTGLYILDQRIISVNNKITSLEKQVYIDNFQSNFINYLENLKVNLSFIMSLEPDQLTNKWVTAFASDYSTLYPAFDSIFLIKNDDIELPYSNNFKHLITQFNFEQKAEISSYTLKALSEDNVIISKPVKFFGDDINYILFYVPVKSYSKNKVLLVLFNLEKIIEQNIDFMVKPENTLFAITSSSNKLIYGKRLDGYVGERIVVEGFKTPIGEWSFEIIAEGEKQFEYLRQLIWILGFALMAFLVFYMLIVEKKNKALVKNLMSLEETELKLKSQHQKEKILEKIIKNIHSATDINELLQFICTEMAQSLMVDYSCFFEIANNAVIKVEHRSEKVKESFIDQQISENNELFNYLVKEKQIIISTDINKDESDIIKPFKSNKLKKFKSLAIFPVVHNENTLSLFAFASLKPNKVFESEKAFIKSAINQIALALYQANLTNELQSRSKTIDENITQEQCLKNIVKVIRTSLDINEIAHYINKELVQYLNIDKAYIIEFDKDQKTVISILGEYSSNSDIPNFTTEKDFIKQFNVLLSILKDSYRLSQLNIPDLKHFFKNDVNKSFDEIFDKAFFAQSVLSTPIIYQEKVFGNLIIFKQNETRNWKYNEREFLTKISEQLALAMYQIRLYDELKNFTDKQVIINKLFNVIRSSIDIDEILNNACTEIGKVLEVDRCGILEIDHEINRTKPFKHEYISSEEYEKAYDMSFYINPDENYMFHCTLVDKRPFVLDDVTTVTDKSNKFLYYLQKYNVKSFAIMPIIYMNKVLAFMILGQVKNKRIWNEAELYFLNSIANQIAIALHQATMFKELNEANKKLLLSYEREQTIRKILELVRSSFNLQDIYKDITEEIGKTLKLDRCYFMEYNNQEDTFNPPSVEYRSSENIPSMINQMLSEDELKLGTRVIKKGAPYFIIDDIDNIKDIGIHPLTSKRLKSKSVVLVPLKTQEKLLGLFIASQTQYNRIWQPDEIQILRIVADYLSIAITQIKMYEYVQETSRLKSEFLASVSHELKTPLNSIIVLSELMQNKDSTKSFEERVELLQIIHSSGEELLKHINNILDMAKVEFTTRETNFQNFSLAEMIEEIRMLIKPLADDKGIKLIVNIEDNVRESVYTDKELLKFIINNLTNNAIKFTHHGYVDLNVSMVDRETLNEANITVANKDADDFLSITVKDSGIGIEEKNFSIIFDEFRQVEDAEVRKYSGTGLGLSICKKSVDILKGTICIKSIPGKGSQFKVIIPISA